MKHTPRTVDTEVNLPRRHPLFDMVWMVTGLSVILLILFLSSGWLVDQVVHRLPDTLDSEIYAKFSADLENKFGEPISDSATVKDVTRIFDALRAQLPPTQQNLYHLVLIDDPMVNAMAVPGGLIVVFRGLLDEAESENEIAMVLAHEFGHLRQKHHWQRLGRGILFAAFAGLLTGNQDTLQTHLSTFTLTGLQRGHDRNQESEADRFGLQMICQLYGHSGGATDFFARHLNTKTENFRFSSFFSTHPHSAERVDRLRALAQRLDCVAGSPTPR